MSNVAYGDETEERRVTIGRELDADLWQSLNEGRPVEFMNVAPDGTKVRVRLKVEDGILQSTTEEERQ